MTTRKPHLNSNGNRLLAALPADEYERLCPVLETVSLEFKEILYEPNKPIGYVYFPNDGVASLLAVMEDGDLVEVGTVGNEGMVGIPVFLGADRTSGLSFSQIPGEAVRMKAEALRAEVERGGPLVHILQRYTQAMFTMLAQHIACNRLHSIRQRCARWLLMSHDRVRADTFVLTQEFLGQMLGARRASVNEVMQALQEVDYVDYRRGVVSILNRERLEAESCECYGIIKQEYDRMLEQL
jgi:CRP-like cAMP-binding protein